MNFTLKTLTLYRDLWYTQNDALESDKAEWLWKYTCGVSNNELEPIRENFLKDGVFLGFAKKNPTEQEQLDCVCIKNSKYLFLQGSIEDKEKDNLELLLEASEKLYLESLWLERTIKNNTVYIRYLEEDGKTVFQIFREVE